MGRFHAAADDKRGGIVDVGVVHFDAVGLGEGCVPCSGVGGGLLDETSKVICVSTDDAQHVVVQIME